MSASEPLRFATPWLLVGCLGACASLLGDDFTVEPESAGGKGGAAGAQATGAAGAQATGGAGGAGGAGPGPCDACSPNATCVPTPKPHCECQPGFTGNGQTCDDIDECLATPPPCHADATCTNAPGSFGCACNPGFVGDGKTCAQQWILETTDPNGGIPLGSWPYVFGHDKRLYYANGDQGSNRFFKSFDASTKSIASEKLMQQQSNDFCGCGFTARPTGLGGSLYVFGNYGQRYDLVSGTWSTLQPYTDPWRRGEAGTAPLGAEVLIVGGRDISNTEHKTVLAYDTKSNTISANKYPDYVWGSLSWPGVANLAGAIYVVGGSVSGLPANKAAVLEPGAQLWKKLPDMPVEMSSAEAAVADGKVFAFGAAVIHFFDPGAGTWSTKPITLPPGGKSWRMAGAAAAIYTLADFPNGIHIYRLNAY